MTAENETVYIAIMHRNLKAKMNMRMSDEDVVACEEDDYTSEHEENKRK